MLRAVPFSHIEVMEEEANDRISCGPIWKGHVFRDVMDGFIAGDFREIGARMKRYIQAFDTYTGRLCGDWLSTLSLSFGADSGTGVVLRAL